MQIAALLTGRGNNTLRNKNILKVLGKPLLSYPCLAAKKSKYINSFWTGNTDDVSGYIPWNLSLITSHIFL